MTTLTPRNHMGTMTLQHQTPPTATEPVAIIDLLRLAVEKGLPVEALERLQALHERVSERAAAAEFAAAFAAFQRSCPLVSRGSEGKITTSGGGAYSYRYAGLEDITSAVLPALRDAGLSYSWDTAEQGGVLQVTCTLRHVSGHRESATFAVPIENRSGMSPQQKPAAAFRTGQRQTLIALLGLTTADPDFVAAASREPVTSDQAEDLLALCEEVGVAPSRVAKWAGVPDLSQIPATDYATVCARVRTARRAS